MFHSWPRLRLFLIVGRGEATRAVRAPAATRGLIEEIDQSAMIDREDFYFPGKFETSAAFAAGLGRGRGAGARAIGFGRLGLSK
jgi:hypothetical protein